MNHPLGTKLWIKCDDGDWWPATVREMDSELFSVLPSHEYDMCVEFYHDPGNLYPVFSEGAGVRLFHVLESDRDEDEQKLFQVAATQWAVRRALLEDERSCAAGKTAQLSLPYSSAELRCMSALLKSVDQATASSLRKTLLTQEGIDLSSRGAARLAAEKKRGQRKKRQRPVEQLLLHPCRDLAPVASEDAAFVSASQSITDVLHEVERGRTFQEPFDKSALELLRREVFENSDRFVLPPIYRCLEVLGAVAVDGVPVETTLPSPAAIREKPDGGFSSSRRVVLVALSASSFDHSEGWMMPFEYEGTTIAMTLHVNGLFVQTPQNSLLPSGKEAIAVRTASVADITDFVLREELFSLAVGFTGLIKDVALWKGVISALFVDIIEMDELVNKIASTYHVPRRVKESDDVVGVQVKLVCPITSLPLEIPVRGYFCEHMQCVELRTLLLHCVRSNVWNCPICWAQTTPQKIVVNYRLKEWLETHRREVSKVDFIVETPFGEPLRPIWRRNDSTKVRDVIAVE